MRVAIVSECFLPVVNGVTNSVLRVLEHLAENGHEALVIAPGTGEATRHGDVEVVRVPAVELPVVNSMPVGVPSRRILTALRRFSPDVVHLAAPFVVGARGLAAARRLGIPTVAVYQTDVAGFASSYGLGLTARAAWRWTCRLHGQADRTLAPSSWATEALRGRGVPRVHQWARGVDTGRFAPSKRSARRREELAPNGEILVGYVGRLAPEKQVERLAALAGLPGVRVVVVGSGPSEERLRATLPGAAMLGFRGGDELAEIYASLDVFVHTGPSETFCQAVQEALASGLAVVAPDAGGPRDLVLPGRTGMLVPPRPDGTDAGDPAADEADAVLRAAVETLCEPGLRAAYRAAARRSVLHRTWSTVCDELLAHYCDVVGAAADRRVA
ncbi:GDP-mannose-dependent alpha-mannosyltransferase [Pseudonocardia sulfidoxydans NBRC 16205]|uniref:GDP-mannose-dependent alpha-mannosyltransferase n=1 Tax=Pseudonocardia sulfidoxydans NBRC 16205 TaxID=1223511 RepID=A0A511DC18_9PSEU|nr:glycosyltransferase family 1 protein [Pseudonocardia sulfidoxydans]GEL22117.1 GDP-mannose-dependent alpha-mannosyltransferase [Pseudonocardia sulfidoxydans NBRC 16205]